MTTKESKIITDEIREMARYLLEYPDALYELLEHVPQARKFVKKLKKIYSKEVIAAIEKSQKEFKEGKGTLLTSKKDVQRYYDTL